MTFFIFGGYSSSYGPQIDQNSAFLQICADLRKKSKSIKTIYLYPSERPHDALSENITFYRGLSNSLQDIEK